MVTKLMVIDAGVRVAFHHVPVIEIVRSVLNSKTSHLCNLWLLRFYRWLATFDMTSE